MTKTVKPVLSLQAFQRMPYYLQYLKELYREGVLTTSSPAASAHFGFTEIQVRKDFAAVCSSRGVPRHGFDTRQLIDDIETLLGYRNTNDAVLVGAGILGNALLQYQDLAKYGLQIVAGFDVKQELVGETLHGKPIFHASKIGELCRRMKIHIGIIAVPAEQAQTVCDQLISGGILAIWNFAPVHLSVPDDILVQNENPAVSLALLSRHLQERLRNGEV